MKTELLIISFLVARFLVGINEGKTNALPVSLQDTGWPRTDNNLFADNQTKQSYIHISGRQFRAGEVNGPWSYAGADLPADLSRAQTNSPAMAIVNKAETEKKVKVTYDGSPEFKSIENTSLQYATNTQEKVIEVDGNWPMQNLERGK